MGFAESRHSILLQLELRVEMFPTSSLKFSPDLLSSWASFTRIQLQWPSFASNLAGYGVASFFQARLDHLQK